MANKDCLEELKIDFCHLDEHDVDTIAIPNEFLLRRKRVGDNPVEYKYKLVHFVDEFGAEWRSLETINRNGYGRSNTIRRLPDNFGSGFINLRELNLRYNNDLTLPNGFGSCLSNLAILSLH